MTTQAGTPPGAPAERPRWKTVAILVFGGLILGVGGCGFFLATLNFNSNNIAPGQVLGGIAFAAGCIMFLIGGLTGLVYVIQALFRRDSRR